MVSGIWASSPLIIAAYMVNYRPTRLTEDKSHPLSRRLFDFLMWIKN
jgi:hypothetical protein